MILILPIIQYRNFGELKLLLGYKKAYPLISNFYVEEYFKACVFSTITTACLHIRKLFIIRKG
jgi:hypothetical protein